MKRIENYQPNRLHEVDETTAPRILSVMSGKGGAGKSVIAHNLAVAFGQSGLRTLLIDFDWRLGSQHVLANASVSVALDSVVTERAYVNDCAIEIGVNAKLLAAPSAVTDCEWPTDQEVRAFLERCRESLFSYDLIIIDTPSGIQSQLAVIAQESDAIALLVNPELTTISDAYGLYKWLVASERNLNIYLLPNRVNGASEATDIAERFSILTTRFLKQKPQIISFLQEDREVRQALARQKAVVDLTPASAFSTQIHTLVSRLSKRLFTSGTPVHETGTRQNALNPIIESADNAK